MSVLGVYAPQTISPGGAHRLRRLEMFTCLTGLAQSLRPRYWRESFKIKDLMCRGWAAFHCSWRLSLRAGCVSCISSVNLHTVCLKWQAPRRRYLSAEFPCCVIFCSRVCFLKIFSHVSMIQSLCSSVASRLWIDYYSRVLSKRFCKHQEDILVIALCLAKRWMWTLFLSHLYRGSLMVQSVRRIGYLNYPLFYAQRVAWTRSVCLKRNGRFFLFFFKVDELHCIICFGNTNMA